MKKIAVLVSSDLSYDQRVDRICTTLSGSYEVELIGRVRRNSIILENKDFQRKRINTGIEKGILFYLILNIRFFLYLLFRKFDYILANDLDTLVAAWLLSKIKRKKLVFDAHEYFEMLPELLNKRTKKQIWKLMARSFVPSASLCYTVGDSLAEKLSIEYGNDFKVIRNVPIVKDYFTIEKEKVYTLIYQGAVNQGRGCEEMIKMMSNLDNTQLWIIGEGDLFSKMENLVLDLSLENKVKLWGYQKPETLKILTQKAHIGINVLNSNSLNYVYSLANKFFDYMHADIPSINMNFVEYQKINKMFEVSVLIERLCVKEILSAVQSLKNNEELYTALSINARNAKQVFSWQNESIRLLDLFQTLEESPNDDIKLS